MTTRTEHRLRDLITAHDALNDQIHAVLLDTERWTDTVRSGDALAEIAKLKLDRTAIAQDVVRQVRALVA